jgi:dinuclear metal center YbgI/SA1388 family protein
MKIKTLTAYLESIAPLSLQEEYDNCGLLIGNAEADLKGILITIDCTDAVLEEAIHKQCNLILSHHPLIFKGLKKIAGNNYTERTVEKAIRNNLAVYAIHTNLDHSPKGVNKALCDRLGIRSPRILSPKMKIAKQEFGSGMIGELKAEINAMAFLETIKQKMNMPFIKHTLVCKKKIKRVAVCGGAGSFLIEEAIQQKADLFITSDIKYHSFFDADEKMILADIGHYESEQFTKELLGHLIMEKFSIFVPLVKGSKEYSINKVFRGSGGSTNVPLHISEVNTNPINYL